MNRLLQERITRSLKKGQHFIWMLAMLMTWNVSQAQQMVCNDQIQVSLDQNCFFRLNLDMLLEAPPADTSCLVIRVIDENGNEIPKGIFGADDRDMLYEYAVLDTCNNNSCWGKVLVEDKLPPQFTCRPYDTVWCSNTDYVLPADKVFEACGDFRRVIESDVSVDFPCDSACAGKRWITYYYLDESDNKSEVCVKEICYRRATLEEVVFPEDTIFNCMDFVDAEPSRTGVPEVDDYPIFPDANFCEVNCDYEDQIIEVCPGTRKILRKWICYNWCIPTGPENPIIDWQVIKVLDEDGPIVYCPGTDEYVDTIGTNVWACTGNTVLPEPHVLQPGQKIQDSSLVYIIAECSKTTYSVKHLAAKSPEDCDPGNGIPSTDHVRFNPVTERWEAFDLPLGCNWFYYYFEDECGNTSECAFDLYVEDNVPPIAVCDGHTQVVLGDSGIARAFAITFDDLSVDNCEIDSMDVRRMDSPCANPTITYGPYVDFCCQDSIVMVEFRVFDKAGNSNTCMVEVDVRDKVAPTMIPPPDITVDCRFDYDQNDLSVFGNVVIDESWRKPIIIKDEHYAPDYFVGLDGWAHDNCEDIKIKEDPEFDLICGIGKIRRVFTATDPQGLKVSRVQMITIIDRDTFDYDDIKWPKDVTMTGCVGVDTDTSKTGYPEYNNVDCAHLAATFKDNIFNRVPDACYKIERKWSVVDWCAFDLNYPVWQWNYTQIIKVDDVEKPFFIDCKDLTFCDDSAYVRNGQCVGAVDIMPEVGDKCTPTNLLQLRHRIDAFNSGTYGTWRPGGHVTGNYPVGEHRIEFEVEDGCGNSERCEFLFEVKDCKAPTPYCRNGIVTVLMEGAGTVDIWASDLDIGSFDNCTDTSNLIFSFDSLGKETSRTYTCDSMNGLWSIRKTVRMYVIDECGNKDYCETIIELQDNKNCIGSFVAVRGKIADEFAKPIVGVDVQAIAVNGAVVTTAVTDKDGNYELNVADGKTYTVKPILDKEPLNGITTRDITMIQRDLLGITPFQSPYQVFAGDASGSRSLAASDITIVRKLILGRIADFNNNTSWRFVQKGFAMNDIRDPWGAPETYTVKVADQPVTDMDFIGMKTGDVDASAETNFSSNKTRGVDDYSMSYEIEELGNSLYRLDFYADGEETLGAFQGTFQLTGSFELIDIESGYCNVSDFNLNLDNSSDGQLAIAWTEMDGMNDEGESLFSLIVHTNQLDGVSLKDAMTEVIAYDLTLNELKWRLDKKEGRKDVSNESFALMQNIPNPFSNSTMIGFELPKDQDFTLSFYDPNGRMLKVIQGYGSKGQNQVRVNQYDFPSSTGSVVFYQLDTENKSATRKLIMMK